MQVARKPRGYWQKGTTIPEALSQRRAAKKELSTTALGREKGTQGLLTAIFREYGDGNGGRGAFERALLDASIDPSQELRKRGPRPKWPKERFVRDLQEAAGKEKVITPAKLSAIRQKEPNWYRMLFYRFPGIAAACESAGVKYARPRPFSTAIKWNMDIIAEKLRALNANDSIQSVDWLKLKHCDLYSAIQYHFKEEARGRGLSRFHAACLHASIDYYAISTTMRSPK